MTPALIHFEHALPALADLGLEPLIPVILQGKSATITREVLSDILHGLSGGANKRAARVLVAVAKATGEDLLDWEVQPAARDRALKEAALMSPTEAKDCILAFFGSLGLSLDVSLGSLVGTEAGTVPADPDAYLKPTES